MKRRYRLQKNSDFQRVRKRGQSKATSIIVLVASPNRLKHSRFGFSVSKRIGKAVKRNKIKRRMREVTRLRLEQIKPGWDIVFIARAPIQKATYRDIEQSIDSLLSRMGLFNTTV